MSSGDSPPRRRLVIVLLTCLAMVAPAVESLLLVRFALGSSLGQYAPQGVGDLNARHALFWSDELDNWHETRTFVTHGLHGGYYTFNEVAPPLPLFRFGPHGPLFPVLYGVVGKIVGWQFYSGPVLNAVLLGLAVLAFVLLARPATLQLMAMVGVLLLCWPVLLFVPSTMQESLHQAVAIALAGLFAACMAEPERGRRHAVAAMSLCLVMGVCRPTWGFLLLPFMLLATGRERGRRMGGLVLVYLATCGLLILAGRLLAPPYPYWFIAGFFTKLRHSPGAALADWVVHVVTNVGRWTQLGSDLPVVVFQRFQLLILLGLATATAARQWRGRAAALSVDQIETIFHLVNLGMPLAFVMVIYDTYFLRDYRFLAPHLLASLFVLIARRRFRGVAAVALLFLASLPGFHQTYRDLHRRHFGDATAMRTLEAELGKHIHYRAGSSAWCNTLIAETDLYPFLKAVPSGIGVSVTMNWKEVARPFKSKYLLVSAEREPLAQANLRLLGRFPHQLYLNLDAQCE